MTELKVKLLNSFKDKTIGLLGREKAYSVFFKTRFGIHTFGMKFPIDVVILDKNNKVVKIFENLKPNRIFFWLPVFDKVLELPKGEIAINKIKLGEKIETKPL